jgi:putative hemolysin
MKISIVTAPFIWMLTFNGFFFIKDLKLLLLLTVESNRGEIKAIIKEGTEGGEVQEIEQDIVERVFHIGDRKINSLMTHRKSVVFYIVVTKVQVKEFMLIELHSIIPFYDKDYDDIVGLLTLKSMANIDEENFNLVDIITEAPFMIEQTTAYKALEKI